LYPLNGLEKLLWLLQNNKPGTDAQLNIIKMIPTFFGKQSDFRKWLEKNHKKETALLVGFYKTGSSKPSITWPQSVDEALCFGWIDGVRKSIDADSYTIRFTPRKTSSIWSAVNIKKMDRQDLPVLKREKKINPGYTVMKKNL
jgi:uncharacterized protein YdeI (YjbR/CyaY-like superfamily)